MDVHWKMLSIECISQNEWAVCIRFCHKQATKQLCRVWFLHWQANTKCVKAAGGRQKEGLGGWERAEQERHRLASSAPSTAWLYATANSFCHSSALLHLRALRCNGKERERGNRGVGWKFRVSLCNFRVWCNTDTRRINRALFSGVIWCGKAVWRE